MRVYISGAITGTTDHRERFDRAAAELKQLGMTPINPEPLGLVMPEDAAHAEFMQICLPLLDLAEMIYMLEGWESSKGARMEFEYATTHGIAIIFQGGRVV